MRFFFYGAKVAAVRLGTELRWAIEELRTGVKGQRDKIVFLNGFRLSEEERLLLETGSSWRKKTQHLTIYKLRKDRYETAVVQLKDSELFKISDVLKELLEFGPINYVVFRDEILKCLYPEEDSAYRCDESVLNYYLNNYEEFRDEAHIPRRFLELYKYVIQHVRGKTVLDVASSSGIFPILLKLKMPDVDVTASDYNYPYFGRFALRYCQGKQLSIKFMDLNILSPPQGIKYDTVTINHALEHFEKDKTGMAVNSLLGLAEKRLIITVPFEKYITQKEHKQILNAECFKKILKPLGLAYKIEQISGWNHAVVVDLG